MDWSKLPLAERERDVRNLLTRFEADQSTVVNNLALERQQSRRRKVRQNDCNMAYRRKIARDRLRVKLSARKKALSSLQNEPKATQKDAQDPRRRPRKTKGKSRQKTSSQAKKMMDQSKDALSQEEKPRPQKSYPQKR
jgi:hypothetical protein